MGWSSLEKHAIFPRDETPGLLAAMLNLLGFDRDLLPVPLLSFLLFWSIVSCLGAPGP